MKFSIITVCYNAEKEIEKTIMSVEAQSYKDIEYIIIDGNSTDRTMLIIKKHSGSISKIISEPDEGIYDAMNKGIRLASGDVVAFMNAGDWYEPDAIEKVYQKFVETGADIVYGKVCTIENGEFTGFIGIENEDDLDRLFERNIYCHQGLFLKRKLFGIVGYYDTKYRILADYDWNLKAHNKGYQFVFLDSIVADYSGGGASATSELEPKECHEIALKHISGHEDYLEKIQQLYLCKSQNMGIELYIRRSIFPQELNKIREPVYVWGAGFNGRLCKRLLDSCGISTIAFIDSHKNKDFIAGLKVLSPTQFFNNSKGIGSVMITPRGCEDEIAEILVKNGIQELNITYFGKILERAGLYYEENV